MKDWNFIERLSQYIDGELPSDQIPALEAELQGSPDKMRVYREYLRIHRGAEALCRGIAAEAVAPKFQMERNVIWVPKAIGARRRGMPAWGAQLILGGAAAGAAVAVYLVPWSADSGPAAPREAVVSIPAAQNTYVISEGGILPGRVSSRVIRSEQPRMDAWTRMVRIEVPSDLPGIPRDLPASVVWSRSEAQPLMAGNASYHGGGWAASTPTFTSYEFRR